MVSPKVKDNLKKQYKVVMEKSINIHEYVGNDFDVAFDVISSETFIAGIADKIIKLISLKPQEKMIIEKKYLVKNTWYLNDGTSYCISHLPELSEYASEIEKLKFWCEKNIN